MDKIFISTGNGMFGRALAIELLKIKAPIRLMVRDKSKCTISDPLAEIVTGDMDKPETLPPLLEGISGLFLCSPMDPRLAQRETTLIKAARKSGVKHFVKIFGAVKHEGDNLDKLNLSVLEFMKNSGIAWTMVSPNSVMETSLQENQACIRNMHAIYGISGNGKVGLVALRDVAEIAALTLTTPGHEGKNYELTGPASMSMTEVAVVFSEVLGKKIDYIDKTEASFTKMILKYDKSTNPEKLELEVLCHLRAWKKGNADLITDTFEQLTGRKPTSLAEFILDNRDFFSKGMVPRPFALMMRWFS